MRLHEGDTDSWSASHEPVGTWPGRKFCDVKFGFGDVPLFPLPSSFLFIILFLHKPADGRQKFNERKVEETMIQYMISGLGFFRVHRSSYLVIIHHPSSMTTLVPNCNVCMTVMSVGGSDEMTWCSYSQLMFTWISFDPDGLISFCVHLSAEPTCLFAAEHKTCH